MNKEAPNEQGSASKFTCSIQRLANIDKPLFFAVRVLFRYLWLMF